MSGINSHDAFQSSASSPSLRTLLDGMTAMSTAMAEHQMQTSTALDSLLARQAATEAQLADAVAVGSLAGTPAAAPPTTAAPGAPLRQLDEAFAAAAPAAAVELPPAGEQQQQQQQQLMHGRPAAHSCTRTTRRSSRCGGAMHMRIFRMLLCATGLGV
jgi:hypothetical protein